MIFFSYSKVTFERDFRVQALILVSSANQSLLMKNNVTIIENPGPFIKLDTNSNEE